MNLPIVIAVDGTAASGKGTLAKNLAKKLGFAYLDTGKLYRYVGYALLQAGENLENEKAAVKIAETLKENLQPSALQDSFLSSDKVGQAASRVAAMPEVRAALLTYQRAFAMTPPHGARGAVLDGRDIGTVICPKAEIKLYIDADIEIRAKRRYKELQSKAISVTYDAVLANMRERDERDSSRKTAPMKPALDAIKLDTSKMSIDDVLETALSVIREKLSIHIF